MSVGIGEKTDVSASPGQDPSIGATYGEGVQVSAEVSGFGDFLSSVGDALITDAVDLYSKYNRRERAKFGGTKRWIRII